VNREARFRHTIHGAFGLALLFAPPPLAGADEIPAGIDPDLLPALPPPTEAQVSNATLWAATEVEEEVVVGAAKREQSLGNVASAVNVITGDRLRRFGYRTISEALRGVAGVFIVEDRIVDRIGIRGIQVMGDFNTRVLVLIDGATANEPWGHFAGTGWDLPVLIDDVARVEIIRGPVSSVYGTNAYFGIINVVTKQASDSSRAWGRIGGSSLTMGQVAAGFAAGNLDRQVRGSVAALLREGEVLSLPVISDQPLDADGVMGVQASLVGAYEGGFAQIRFFRRKREVPWAPYNAEPGPPNYAQYDTLLLAEGGYTRELSQRLTVGGRTYANIYRYADALHEMTGDTAFEALGKSYQLGGEARARLDLVEDKLNVNAGGEIAYNDTVSSGGYQGQVADITVPSTFHAQGIYAELETKPTSWLGLTGGLRYDLNSTFENKLSPRVALLLSHRDRLGLKLLYAQGFRNPSPFEAFFDDGSDFIANPDLKAETIRSYEAVLWARPLPGLSARVSGFHWEADRLMEQEGVDTADGPRLQFQNVGELTTSGVELEASLRNRTGWFVFAGGAFTRVEAGRLEGGSTVTTMSPGSPRWSGAGGVSTPRLWGMVHLSSEVVAVGRRPSRDPATITRRFVGWNAALHVPSWRKIDITIGARNLIGKREIIPAQEEFDRVEPQPDGTLVPFILGEGREFYARVGYSY
jgi:iron complex outermembrane receptor protein